MKFLIGKKLHMTQVFETNGRAVPVTAVLVRDNVVTQIKNTDKDGYSSIQIGTDARRLIKKPQAGHLKDLGNFRVLREFVLGVDQTDRLKRGDRIALASFAKGDKVEVIGTTKGKGFQGVVKRHGFHGQDSSHGHKDQERMPGSIGAGGVQRVFKNVKMAGHMGDSQVTIKGLEVVEIDADNSIVYIKGALPGARNGLVLISGAGELTVEEPVVAAVVAPAEEAVVAEAESAVETAPADAEAVVTTVDAPVEPEEAVTPIATETVETPADQSPESV